MRDEDKPDKPDDVDSVETMAEAPTVADFDAQRPDDEAGGVLTPGQQFGSYEIIRLLGKGGMGEAYEAYDSNTERHVALKVLRERQASESDRKRFLREGQLAAQVSHPNSVFVFGTEEIGGTQVIVMELMAGGTLKDRIDKEGPLPVREAVDLILEITAGLEAAATEGVLHRDIKPSNCFVGGLGRVLVGDFGLSIPSAQEDRTRLTLTGQAMGTPAFSSPEQMQGEDLDIRSDIYSVGATLFFLLTGRPVFVADTPARMIAKAVIEQPPSVASLRPGVPQQLDVVLQRCLAKRRAIRFGSYAELKTALGSLGSAGPRPATLIDRAQAGVLDWVALLAISHLVSAAALAVSPAVSAPSSWTAAFLAVVVYYWLMESRFRQASVGKMLLGARVLTTSGDRASPSRIALRTLIFLSPEIVYFGVSHWARGQLDQGMEQVDFASVVILAGVAATALQAGLFVTVSRRNGYAAVHDLLSGTRVAEYRVPDQATGRRQAHEEPSSGQVQRIGPYEIVRPLGSTGSGELMLAYDRDLNRRVWLHSVGAPADLGAAGGQADRHGVRFLAGVRGRGQQWAVYEAPDGHPVDGATPTPWERVRLWLVSLARRLAEQPKVTGPGDGLSIGRIWVSPGDRAVLLPFDAPRAGPSSDAHSGCDSSAHMTSAELLSQLARVGLEGGSQEPVEPNYESLPRPLPISARRFLRRLSGKKCGEPRAILDELEAMSRVPSRVTRRHRLQTMSFFAVGVLAIFSTLFTGAFAIVLWRSRYPEMADASTAVHAYEDALADSMDPLGPETRRAIELYLGQRFAPVVKDEALWNSDVGNLVALGPSGRERLQNLVAQHDDMNADQFGAASAIAEPILAAHSHELMLYLVDPIAMSVYGGAWAIFAILAAGVMRTGAVYRLARIAVVTRAGVEASRLRSLLRSAIAWSPLLLACSWAPAGVFDGELGDLPAMFGLSALISVSVFLAGAVYAIVQPERGIQDRIAGTYLVPR